MCPDAGAIKVRRVYEPRSKIKDEAVVEFSSAPIRDTIKGSGYKLEGRNASTRMEVPLRSDFHVLQNLSYRMKINNVGMKRSIKFDDANLGLLLDVQLPGQDWQRIRPEQARLAGQSDPSLRVGPLEMSSDMIAGTVKAPIPTATQAPAPLQDPPRGHLVLRLRAAPHHLRRVPRRASVRPPHSLHRPWE